MKKYQELWKALIAVLVILVFYLVPPLEGLSKSGMWLLGIFIGSVFLWITVGISWPSLFTFAMVAMLPEVSMNQLVASSLGNSAIAFLIFTFCCSYALNQTPFIRRCAVKILTSRMAQKGPWIFLMFYFGSILLLGSCMSTTVIVVLYLTINEEIYAILGIKKGDSFAALLTMGLVIVSGISGAMTPIAHVFPVMALSSFTSLTGETISYAAYMAAGIPAALLATACMLLMFRFILRPDMSALQVIDTSSLKKGLEKADQREYLTAGVFFCVVALWVFPELLKNVLPAAKWFVSFGSVYPPLLGAMVLCILKIDGKPLLKLEDGAKSVPWICLFMAEAALGLASAMTNEEIGLITFVKERLEPLANSVNGFVFVLLMIAITAVLTNVGSNLVTVTIMCTICLPAAMALTGSNIDVAALAVVLGMMSAYAFATPPAMTTVTLGVGSGWVSVGQMAKYGFLILVPSILIVGFIAYPIAAQLL